MLADLSAGRQSRVLALYIALYAIVASLASAPFVLRLCNGVAISVTAGVCITYAPVWFEAMVSRRPTRIDYLGSGIFHVSASLFGIRALSMFARDLGDPEVYNGPAMPIFVAIGIFGGLQHMWAYAAHEDGRIPTGHWRSTGIVVGAGLFLAFLAWWAHSAIGSHPIVLL